MLSQAPAWEANTPNPRNGILFETDRGDHDKQSEGALAGGNMAPVRPSVIDVGRLPHDQVHLARTAAGLVHL